MEQTIVLRGGRILDPGQGVDRKADLIIRGDKIAAIGGEVPAGAEIVDVTGKTISPGWVDIHMHAYGTLGFADVDSIGVYQGVTSFVDAGGPGIGSLDEFAALFEGHLVTSLYAGPYIRPMGIIGAQFIEGDLRSLTGFPIPQWLEFMEKHPGLVRYLKVAALGSYGAGPIRMGKGLAEIIGVPLYGHIGEYQMQPEHPSAYELFRISQAGDIITHIYHNNGARILDADGRIMPVVRDAQKRGVLFDIGFGSYNYSWDVAEQAFAQDLRAHVISSDLQQYNAIGPVYSLAHVMGVFLRLGMTEEEVIDAVTWSAAKSINLQDRAGALRPGMPADITVFHVEHGEYEYFDTYNVSRTGDRRFVPDITFKAGRRIDCDLTRCQDEKNWLLQIADDHVPAAAAALTGAQLEFLGAMAAALQGVEWTYDLSNLDLVKATELQGLFHAVRRRHGLGLREALLAMYACFLDSPFTMQIGLFILHLERGFALARLAEVAGPRRLAA